MILTGKPGTFLLEGIIMKIALLHPDLAVTMTDVSSWSGHGLEGDGSLSPEAGTEDLEHLGLGHEVALDALVDGPVVAGPVLGGDPHDHVAWN